jgi:predicted short-subunit dehydrogenase-like oxidoreductase (DUF2520 family)
MRPTDSRAMARKASAGGRSLSRSVAIVGLGKFGTALALALDAAGVPVAELVVRGVADASQKKLALVVGARISSWRDAGLDADLVWLCVADGEIGSLAAELAARWKSGKRPQVLLHSSGVLGSGVLAPVKKLGTAAGSAHPFRSFPQRAVATASLRGVLFGVEGDAAAVRAARSLVLKMGGEAFSVNARSKALYHATGSFASGLMVALLAAAAEAGGRAGIAPKTVAKLLRSLAGGTFQNWYRNGAAASFGGPIVRGDVETIRLHLASLQGTPELAAIYRALSGYAVEHLPGEKKSQLRAELQETRFARTVPGRKPADRGQSKKKHAGARAVSQSKRGRG